MAKTITMAKDKPAVPDEVVLYDVVCDVEHLLGAGLDIRAAIALAQAHNAAHQNETPAHNATLTRRQS
jgi:hypothetical protein